MNADLSLYFLFLATSPLTVKPSTGHGEELIGKAKRRKGEQEAQFELISVVNVSLVFSYYVKCKKVCFWDQTFKVVRVFRVKLT